MFIQTAAQAEQNAADRMREIGFTDACVTSAGADAGIDVWSSTGLAQVKLHMKPVGRPDIQRLVGARGHDHHLELLFFAYSGFSAGAREYADQMNIGLFSFDPTGAISAFNGSGSWMLERAETVRVRDASAATIFDISRHAEDYPRITEDIDKEIQSITDKKTLLDAGRALAALALLILGVFLLIGGISGVVAGPTWQEKTVAAGLIAIGPALCLYLVQRLLNKIEG